MLRRYAPVFLLVISMIAVVMFVLVKPWEADDAISTITDTATAPQPHTPANDSYFVDSTLTLAWSWPPGLNADQAFAVRVWYGDDEASHREAWIATPAFDAADAIDSYLHDVGDFHWQVAVINLTEVGGFGSMGSQWSAVQTLQRVRHISPTAVPAEDRSPAAQLILATNPPDTTALIDTARNFVRMNSNSQTQDEEFAADYSDALDMMAAYAAGEGEMPHVQCDGMSTAMLTLLAELGIDSHLIFLYADGGEKIGEHTMLEVFNPGTQRWEVHDLSSNRYIVDENGDRVSIERLVFGELSITSVCSYDHTCKPFYEANYPAEQLFEAFRYGHSDTFWVNPDRFDVSQRFPANGNRNLAEYKTGNARDFTFRFDNWIPPAP